MYLKNIHYLRGDYDFTEEELVEANQLTEQEKKQIWDKGFHTVSCWDKVNPVDFLVSRLDKLVSSLEEGEDYALFTFESGPKMKTSNYQGLFECLIEDLPKKPCLGVNLDMSCYGPSTIINSISHAIYNNLYDTAYVVVLSDLFRTAVRPSIYDINRLEAAMVLEFGKSGKYKLKGLYTHTETKHLDLFNPNQLGIEKLRVTSTFLKDEGIVLRELIGRALNEYDIDSVAGVSLPIITLKNQKMIEKNCSIEHIKPNDYPVGTFACGDTFLPLVDELLLAKEKKYIFLCSLGAAFTWNLLVLEIV